MNYHPHSAGPNQGGSFFPDLPEIIPSIRTALMTSPEVSVIIPGFGRAAALANCLRALAAQTLPRAHIVLASIEKVVPTLEDVTTLLRVLARSATGHENSV